MLPDVIGYLLSMRGPSGEQICTLAQNQVVIPNFPALSSFNYSIMPVNPTKAYILYELAFGESMIPHAFDVRITRGGDTVLDVIVSGRFTQQPIQTFTMIGHHQPNLQINATNIRELDNYYELATSFIATDTADGYARIMDAIRRMNTSELSETLLKEISNKSLSPAYGGMR